MHAYHPQYRIAVRVERSIEMCAGVLHMGIVSRERERDRQARVEVVSSALPIGTALACAAVQKRSA